MRDLLYRQTKIQDKRKQTLYRDFIMEICSRRPMTFYKGDEGIQKFPTTDRKGVILGISDYITIDFEDYGLETDADQSFIQSYQQLFLQAPKSTVFHYFDNDNCDYADQVHASKNGYLSVGVTGECDTVLYSFFSKESKNIINSICSIDYSENIYQSSGTYKSYNIFYSKFTFDSANIWFSSNLQGCTECIFCNDLQNQSYRINNIQYTQDEYIKEKASILADKSQFAHHWSKVSLIPVNRGSTDSTGKFVINSDHVENGLYAYKIHNGRNIAFGGGSGTYENLYDIFTGGGCAHHYGVIFSGGKSQHIYCSIDIGACSNMYYCMYCNDCSFCVGCIGLSNKSYYILNKQYSKEERYEKVDEIFTQMDQDGTLGEIFTQMDQDGTLGEFFPASMNPFYFNDTAAYLIDPSFTKEEVIAAGYLWRDEPIKVDIPEGAEVIKTDELGQYEGWRHPEGNEGSSVKMNGLSSSPRSEGQNAEGQQRHIDPSILKKIIQDEAGNVYRIVPMEYEFLMKYGLPLPRKHRLDRMKENFLIS